MGAVRFYIEFRPSFDGPASLEITAVERNDARVYLKGNQNYDVGSEAEQVIWVQYSDVAGLLERVPRYLHEAKHDKVRMGLDGITVCGVFEPSEGEATDFKFWSPRERDAGQRLVADVFAFVKTLTVQANVSRSFRGLRRYFHED